jgi:hypothetical protein
MRTPVLLCLRLIIHLLRVFISISPITTPSMQNKIHKAQTDVYSEYYVLPEFKLRHASMQDDKNAPKAEDLSIKFWYTWSEGERKPKKSIDSPLLWNSGNDNDDKDKGATQSFKKARMDAIPHPPAINKTGTSGSDGNEMLDSTKLLPPCDCHEWGTSCSLYAPLLADYCCCCSQKRRQCVSRPRLDGGVLRERKKSSSTGATFWGGNIGSKYWRGNVAVPPVSCFKLRIVWRRGAAIFLEIDVFKPASDGKGKAPPRLCSCRNASTIHRELPGPYRMIWPPLSYVSFCGIRQEAKILQSLLASINWQCVVRYDFHPINIHYFDKTERASNVCEWLERSLESCPWWRLQVMTRRMVAMIPVDCLDWSCLPQSQQDRSILTWISAILPLFETIRCFDECALCKNTMTALRVDW